MSDDFIKELIESFIAYRDLLAPLEESLRSVSKTYAEIREDLDKLSENLSGGAANQLERVHATLNAQAKSRQELGRRIEEYAQSGERYAQAVSEMSSRFTEVAQRVDSLEEIEKNARTQIERIDALIEEKKNSYNLKELQKTLDRYNANLERMSEFVNRDVARVMVQNAEKLETVRRENEELSKLVQQQNRDLAALTAAFSQTTALLKTTVEGSVVNEQYLFDVLDKWAAERKIKIKKQ